MPELIMSKFLTVLLLTLVGVQSYIDDCYPYSCGLIIGSSGLQRLRLKDQKKDTLKVKDSVISEGRKESILKNSLLRLKDARGH